MKKMMKKITMTIMQTLRMNDMLTFKDFTYDADLDEIFEQFTDDDIEEFYNILEAEDRELVDLEEVRMQKIRVADRRSAHRNYIRNKRQILRKQKVYRRKQQYKDYLRKKKRMARVGRTSTGKFQRTKKYV